MGNEVNISALRANILAKFKECGEWDKDKFNYLNTLSDKELISAFIGDEKFVDDIHGDLFQTALDFDTATMGQIYAKLYKARQEQGLANDGDIHLLDEYMKKGDFSYKGCEKLCEEVTGGQWDAAKKLLLDLVDGLGNKKLSDTQMQKRQNASDNLYALSQDYILNKPIYSSWGSSGKMWKKYKADYPQYVLAQKQQKELKEQQLAKQTEYQSKEIEKQCAQIMKDVYPFTHKFTTATKPRVKIEPKLQDFAHIPQNELNKNRNNNLETNKFGMRVAQLKSEE